MSDDRLDLRAQHMLETGRALLEERRALRAEAQAAQERLRALTADGGTSAGSFLDRIHAFYALYRAPDPRTRETD